MRRVKFTGLFFAILVPAIHASTTPDCEKWFFGTGVEPGSNDCLPRCASSSVGMDSFTCPQECKELCKIYLPSYIVDELTFAYSLQKAEKNLIAKYPKDALSVFLAKREAIDSTKRIFKRNGHNDESDGFRHFMWSGLVTHKIGEERARLFLDAHEQDPNQPVAEGEMDSYNNGQGMSEAKRLQKDNSFSTENLEKAALKALRDGKLNVIEPRGKVPDWR